MVQGILLRAQLLCALTTGGNTCAEQFWKAKTHIYGLEALGPKTPKESPYNFKKL